MKKPTTISGLICNYDALPQYGTITVGSNGIISNVEFGPYDGKSTYTFGPAMLIFPGFIDLHVHSREDDTGKQLHKESYTTAFNAALNGGVIMVGHMPNTPHPVTDTKTKDWHTTRQRNLNHPVRGFNYLGIGVGTQPTESYHEKYKAYTGPSVGNLFFTSQQQFEEATQHYKGKNVSYHVEDYDWLVLSRLALNHSLRRPVDCVEKALHYVLAAIEDHNINAKLCHWSTGKHSFEMIAEHRDRMEKKGLGYNTTIEVSPMHLLCNADDVNAYPWMWPLHQMNPAIQGRDHQQELLEGLRSGFIDYLATDHAPHTLDEKYKIFTVDHIKGLEQKEQETGEQQFSNLNAQDRLQLKDYIDRHQGLSPEEIALKIRKDEPELCDKASCENGTSGAPWLDTYSLVAIELMDVHGFSPMDIARSCAYNPGLFVNGMLEPELGKGFGKIAPGYVGSFTVINPVQQTTLSRDALQSKVGWSLLEERTFNGGLEAVIIEGIDLTGQFL